MKLNLGENIRRLRRAKDWTQDELADAIAARDGYKSAVAHGLADYDPDRSANLETAVRLKQARYDSFWTAFGGGVTVDGVDKKDAAVKDEKDFRNGKFGRSEESAMAAENIRKRYFKAWQEGARIGEEFSGR